ncbi:MAG: bifunctional hydroxymethylpyrimidine kinase/phosphomethylpyrimidine kinase, partial [Acidobacteriaceae bacterium]
MLQKPHDVKQLALQAIALTIAGLDPTGGAGATADLQVMAAHGLVGVTALTALTVQST